MSRYRFYLAFENSRCLDYVTEKLFRPLMMGSVPICLGAPNARDFLPAPEAALFAEDFSSPQELAAHLKALVADEEAYEAHLAWKGRPWSRGFEGLIALGSIEARVRLAIKLAHGCERGCPCGGRMRDRP